MDLGRVTAVCRVHALAPDRGWGVTAIDKRPVAGAVRVHDLGLHGDVQADRRHHGGTDQAVYAYADEDADRFAALLGAPPEPGRFGENLRTSGVDVTGAVLGERWRVGDRLLLEVTYPRDPCGTFERRMRMPGWVERFRELGMPGAYLRVLRAGDVRVGDPVEIVDRPAHGVTVGDWFRFERQEDAAALDAEEAAGRMRLGRDLRRHVDKALARS